MAGDAFAEFVQSELFLRPAAATPGLRGQVLVCAADGTRRVEWGLTTGGGTGTDPSTPAPDFVAIFETSLT